MAITAKFVADFSSFETAVEKATVELKSFETGAGKVEKSLNRMVDSLSGRKLIQDAALMEKAVAEIGGVSKLTEKELLRVGQTAGEAVEKMKRLGLEVPPGLQKIASEAQAADKAHGALGSTVKQLAVGFAALFTVRAALNFTKDILNDASALKDLSAQTHINVEEIQFLSGAISEFGVDADTLAKGLFTLSRKIEGGDDSIVRALHLMGMSLKDVQGLQGEALFLQIEHGLSTLQGSLRDTAASELFGSRLGMAMAGASEGIDAALRDARRLNTVMTTESVEALDKWGESIERAKRSLAGFAANQIGPVAEGFNVLNDAVVKGATKWELFVAMFKDFTNSGVRVGAHVDHLATLLDRVNREADKGKDISLDAAKGHRANAAALTEEGQAARFMAALQMDVTAKLTATQRTHLSQLKELGQLSVENAAAVGVSAAQFKKYERDIQAAEKATGKHTEELKKHDAALKAAYQSELAMGRQALQTSESLRGLAATGGMIADSFAMAQQQMAGFTATTKEAAKFDLGALFTMGKIAPPSMEQFKQTFGTTFAEVGASLPTLLMKGLTGGGGAKGALNALGVSLSDSLFGPQGVLSKATTAATGGLTKVFGSTIGGALGAAIPGIGALIGPAIQGLGKLFGKLFGGPSKEELGARAAQDDMLKGLRDIATQGQITEGALASNWQTIGIVARDAFLQTGSSAAGADVLVKGLLDTGHPARFEQALKDLNKALGALNAPDFPDFPSLTKTAKDYGIELGALGPQFQQANISGTAKTIHADFLSLLEAGGDVNGIMLGMRDEVSTLLSDAKRFGSAIPPAMKPMIDTFFNAGLLVDDQGEKLKDLSGITFAESPLEKGLGELTKATNDLILALGGVPGKITDLGKTPVPTIRIPVEYDYADMRGPVDAREFHQGGVVLPREFHQGGVVLPFVARAHRGLAIGEVPIIAQAGEGILNKGALQRLGGAPALNALNAGATDSGGAAVVAAKLDTLEDELAGLRRDFLFTIPGLIAKANMTALAKAGRRG